MLTLRQLLTKTPSEVRVRAQQCGFTLDSEREMRPERARGKNPYLEQVFISHCLDGDKKVTVRFAAGVTDKNSLVWVSCTCPFWLYYCEFAVARTGSTSIIYCNGQPPFIRNPKRIPYLCKHLYAVGSRVVTGKKRKADVVDVDNVDMDQQAMEDAAHLTLLYLSRAPKERRDLEQDLADVAPLHVIRAMLELLVRQGLLIEQGTALQVTPKGLSYLVTLG